VHAARGWADLAQTLSERAAHARAVNLDPASVILDMLLKIDQMAATSRAA
ncbi:MAG TPA: DNA polymerase III subunit delta', partial [Rhodobacteraceae bacterium]|nr:DNA polymerase III subunit delta' [Paracoccaceae bacterium]